MEDAVRLTRRERPDHGSDIVALGLLVVVCVLTPADTNSCGCASLHSVCLPAKSYLNLNNISV